jgi:hypothetical protein
VRHLSGLSAGGSITLGSWPKIKLRLGPASIGAAVGFEFMMSGSRWCWTDIGTRLVDAIQLSHEDDPSWYKGPSYAVEGVYVAVRNNAGKLLSFPAPAPVPE